jgi:hypothetical protein
MREIRVMKWQGEAWQGLPSPRLGDLPALDFTHSGSPLLAYAEGDARIFLRVRYFKNDAWVPVGGSVSDETDRPIEQLALSVEAGGRPSVAWSQLGCEGLHTNIFLKRYSAPLP